MFPHIFRLFDWSLLKNGQVWTISSENFNQTIKRKKSSGIRIFAIHLFCKVFIIITCNLNFFYMKVPNAALIAVQTFISYLASDIFFCFFLSLNKITSDLKAFFLEPSKNFH